MKFVPNILFAYIALIQIKIMAKTFLLFTNCENNRNNLDALNLFFFETYFWPLLEFSKVNLKSNENINEEILRSCKFINLVLQSIFIFDQINLENFKITKSNCDVQINTQSQKYTDLEIDILKNKIIEEYKYLAVKQEKFMEFHEKNLKQDLVDENKAGGSVKPTQNYFYKNNGKRNTNIVKKNYCDEKKYIEPNQINKQHKPADIEIEEPDSLISKMDKKLFFKCIYNVFVSEFFAKNNLYFEYLKFFVIRRLNFDQKKIYNNLRSIIKNLKFDSIILENILKKFEFLIENKNLFFEEKTQNINKKIDIETKDQQLDKINNDKTENIDNKSSEGCLLPIIIESGIKKKNGESQDNSVFESKNELIIYTTSDLINLCNEKDVIKTSFNLNKNELIVMIYYDMIYAPYNEFYLEKFNLSMDLLFYSYKNVINCINPEINTNNLQILNIQEEFIFEKYQSVFKIYTYDHYTDLEYNILFKKIMNFCDSFIAMENIQELQKFLTPFNKIKTTIENKTEENLTRNPCFLCQKKKLEENKNEKITNKEVEENFYKTPCHLCQIKTDEETKNVKELKLNSENIVGSTKIIDCNNSVYPIIDNQGYSIKEEIKLGKQFQNSFMNSKNTVFFLCDTSYHERIFSNHFFNSDVICKFIHNIICSILRRNILYFYPHRESFIIIDYKKANNCDLLLLIYYKVYICLNLKKFFYQKLTKYPDFETFFRDINMLKIVQLSLQLDRKFLIDLDLKLQENIKIEYSFNQNSFEFESRQMGFKNDKSGFLTKTVCNVFSKQEIKLLVYLFEMCVKKYFFNLLLRQDLFIATKKFFNIYHEVQTTEEFISREYYSADFNLSLTDEIADRIAEKINQRLYDNNLEIQFQIYINEICSKNPKKTDKFLKSVFEKKCKERFKLVEILKNIQNIVTKIILKKSFDAKIPIINCTFDFTYQLGINNDDFFLENFQKIKNTLENLTAEIEIKKFLKSKKPFEFYCIFGMIAVNYMIFLEHDDDLFKIFSRNSSINKNLLIQDRLPNEIFNISGIEKDELSINLSKKIINSQSKILENNFFSLKNESLETLKKNIKAKISVADEIVTKKDKKMVNNSKNKKTNVTTTSVQTSNSHFTPIEIKTLTSEERKEKAELERLKNEKFRKENAKKFFESRKNEQKSLSPIELDQFKDEKSDKAIRRAALKNKEAETRKSKNLIT